MRFVKGDFTIKASKQKRLGQKFLPQPQKPPISRFKIGGLAAFKRVPKG